MTHIKNLRLTKALEGISQTKKQNNALTNLLHLCTLSSTVYVFLYKEEYTFKLAK